MTELDINALKATLKSLDEDIVGLYRTTLAQKAWISVLYGQTVEIIGEKTGKPKEEIKAFLVERHRAAYQKLLEKQENRDPGLAARLDNRNLDEIS